MQIYCRNRDSTNDAYKFIILISLDYENIRLHQLKISKESIITYGVCYGVCSCKYIIYVGMGRAFLIKLNGHNEDKYQELNVNK